MQAQKIIMHYLDFVTQFMRASYESLIPGLELLCNDFGLEPGLALTLLRPVLKPKLLVCRCRLDFASPRKLNRTSQQYMQSATDVTPTDKASEGTASTSAPGTPAKDGRDTVPMEVDEKPKEVCALG